CRHGLFAARRRRDRLRRQRGGGASCRARAVERSGHGRDAPRRRGLRHRDRLRARAQARSAVPRVSVTPAILWRNARVVPCTSIATAATVQADAIVTDGARIEWVGREAMLP